MIKYLRMPLALAVIVCAASLARAQEVDRRIEEEKRQSVDTAHPQWVQEYQRVLVEYGGWFNYRFTELKNPDNNNSQTDPLDSFLAVDSRLWMKLTLKPPEDAAYDNRHFLYLRGKNLYLEQYGDDSVERYDNDGPHLDYAFAMLDFTPYRIEAGRRYFFAGRGIAYGDVNDGIQFNYFRPGWNVGAFAAHTLPHQENIDLSVPGYDKESDRTFYGLGAGYAGFKDQVFYVYSVIQRDSSDERPEDPAQQYTYNSEYFSIGGQGKLAAYQYWFEVIKQYGSTRVFDTNERTDVDAFGATAGLRRIWDVSLAPSASIEYAFGSGDKDRVSVTDTLGGNLSGDDHNFLYFGYMPAGIALSPRLSNLHLFRVGVSLDPLPDHDWFRHCRIGIDYYVFQKHKKEGSISDFEATLADRDIGQEIDFYLDWRVLSDLNLSLEYGHFMPGGAYPDEADDAEDYFSVSLTHTF